MMRLAIADYLLRQPETTFCEAARHAGLAGVELTYGPVAGAERPWFQDEGPTQIRALAEKQNVALASLSATFFWWHRLFEAVPFQQQEYTRLIEQLLEQAATAAIPVFHLPCFDAPTPNEPDALRRVLDVLHPLATKAATQGVTIALETLWPAEDMHRFLARVGNRALKMAYDVGNACAANRDAVAELTLLGEDVVQIRVKDRERLEPFTTVRLGEGGVNFPALLKCLGNAHFDGWLILTTPSSDDPLAEARRNAGFLHRLLALADAPAIVGEVRAKEA
jgi:sugar phosphate isomerase/epimerase